MAVSNSRPQKNRNQTWRRRLCKGCGAVFTSIESIDLSQAIVVIRTADNTSTTERSVRKFVTAMEPFDRDRLFISIYESLRHRHSAASDARGLCDTVIAHIIIEARDGSVGVRTVTQTVLNTLQRFDVVGASHYGAFHTLAA